MSLLWDLVIMPGNRFVSDADDCAGRQSACWKNSKCVDGIETHHCICLPGFTGQKCSISESFSAYH